MRLPLIVSLLAMAGLAACKNDDDGDGQLADAPPSNPDAKPDVPTDTASGPMPITLTVLHNGSPVSGIQTYFLAADGSLADAAKTNDDGVASSVKADGGSVTAINPFKPEGSFDPDDLRTFMAVKAGDHLVLRQNDDASDEPTVDATLTAPAGDEVFPIDTWDVFTTCGTGSISPVVDELAASAPTGQITLTGCNGVVDILVLGSSEGNPIAALYHPNFPLPASGPVDITLADAYQSLKQVDLRYTNLPRISGVDVKHTLGTARGSLALSFFGGQEVGGGGATIHLQGEPVIEGLRGVIDTDFRLFGNSRSNDHHVLSLAPVATAYDLDMASTTNLPLAGFVELQEYDLEQQRVLWTSADTGAVADLTFVELSVQRNLGRQAVVPGLPPPPGQDFLWRIVAPHVDGTDEVKFPALPATPTDWTPASTDFISVRRLMNVKAPGHYDAVRAEIHNAIGSSRNFDEDRDIGLNKLTAGGSVATVELGPVEALTRRAPARTQTGRVPARGAATPGRR